MVVNTKKTIAADSILYALLIPMAAFALLPVLWLLFTAIKPPGEVFIFPPELLPRNPQWGNFATAWNTANFPRYFYNTVFVTVSVVMGQIITCSMAAFSFSRLRYRGRDTLFLAYLGTMMIPIQVTLIPSFILITRMGWQNTYQALIMPAMFSAFGTFLLRQFFMTIPLELDEAARIDGASYFRIYASIIMPLSKTALVTLGVLAFLGTWNAFLWPLVVVNRDEMRTLTLGLVIFRGMYTAQWHLIMSATVISIMPIFAIYIFAQRYFIEGVAMSSIKG